ncbi:MAG: ribosome biogenesis GTPase Der [Betaproteobacteria bacterium]|nr:ribosome biogenesis GTPase Der [Betaproteobacteria bacterium]
MNKLPPRIAICGRPNVGKSSLFNCLLRSGRAIVHNRPGVTRDPLEQPAADLDCILIDTAGVEDEDESQVKSAARRQALRSAAAADAILLVVDGRSGLVPADSEMARSLRKIAAGSPLALVVNKCEGKSAAAAAAEFFALGIEPVITVSATHGIGIGNLREHVAATAAQLRTKHKIEIDSKQAVDDGKVRISLLGRPNAGKSTLANKIARAERMIVSQQPGTTIDAVDIEFSHRGRNAVLVDTAGVRRKSLITDSIEQISSRTARDAIASANVVLLVLDASEGVSHQDQRLARLIAESGRAAVVILNKSDLLDAAQKRSIRRNVVRDLPHLSRATFMLVAASQPRFSGKRVIDAAFAALRRARVRFSAAAATKALKEAVARSSPPRRGNTRPKLTYAHQAGSEPPAIAVHGRNLHLLSQSYQRYLTSQLASSLGIGAAPLVLKLVDGESAPAGRSA